MKRILISLFAVFVICSFASAQSTSTTGNSMLRFSFNYIAHDETSPVSAIIERLQEDYNNAIEDEEFPHPVVFYLASDTRPIIVRVNVPGDNRNDFEDLLLPELYQRNAHEVDPETDIIELNKLFDEIGLVDNSNRLRYSSARFNFYVNPQFWSVRNNEKIIAPMFMGLDIPNMQGKLIDWSVFQPARNHISYPKGKPFGEKDVCGINEYMEGKIYEIGD